MGQHIHKAGNAGIKILAAVYDCPPNSLAMDKWLIRQWAADDRWKRSWRSPLSGWLWRRSPSPFRLRFRWAVESQNQRWTSAAANQAGVCQQHFHEREVVKEVPVVSLCPTRALWAVLKLLLYLYRTELWRKKFLLRWRRLYWRTSQCLWRWVCQMQYCQTASHQNLKASF